MTTETVPLPEAISGQLNVAPVSNEPNAPAPEPETKAESTPPVEGSDATKPEPEKTEDKPKRSANGRIAELYAQKRTAEADAFMARQDAARLQAELDKIAAARADPNLPFEQQDELRMRQAVKQERAEQANDDANRKAEAASRQRYEMFQERVAGVRDRLPDFDTVVTDSTPISEVAAELIAESEVGPQIAYHLGKNPADARRIASLPPHLQGAEIARIEAKVSVPIRKVSNAPAPTPQVGGGSSPSARDPNDMPMSEFATWFKKASQAR